MWRDADDDFDKYYQLKYDACLMAALDYLVARRKGEPFPDEGMDWREVLKLLEEGLEVGAWQLPYGIGALEAIAQELAKGGEQ